MSTAATIASAGGTAAGAVVGVALVLWVLSMSRGWQIASRKGYPPWLGLILGLLLSLIGLLIVVVLPARHSRAAPATAGGNGLTRPDPATAPQASPSAGEAAPPAAPARPSPSDRAPPTAPPPQV